MPDALICRYLPVIVLACNEALINREATSRKKVSGVSLVRVAL